MHLNVNIVSTGSYFPEIIKDNEHYVDYYQKYDLEDKFIKVANRLGVKERKLTRDGETTLSMSVISCKEALRNANLKPEDIDIIISATNTPEFLTPCCAILLRHKLQSKASVCYDINCDCIGMLHGINQAYMHLKTNKKYKRAMIVGSFIYSKFSTKDNIITNGIVGDNSTAIILESKEEEIERGFINLVGFTDSNYNEYIRFPACGLSQILNDNIKEDFKRVKWLPFDANCFSTIWIKIINECLMELKLQPKDISEFFMSQFSKEQIIKTMDGLNISQKKAPYIGDKYGYTGPTSPLLALHLRLKEKQFNDGEYCIFCSVGAGISMLALTYKW